MIPRLYEKTETSFPNNCLAYLSDTISAKVTRDCGYDFELELEYPINGVNADLLKIERIIVVKTDNTSYSNQPFEIYSITHKMSGKITVYAWHIFNKLRRRVINPYGASSLSGAIYGLSTSTISSVSPFSFQTTMTGSNAFPNLGVPMSVLDAMKRIQEVYGGEWDFVNNICTLKSQLGNTLLYENYAIRYGKNLRDAKTRIDSDSYFTGVVPYWTNRTTGVSTYYEGIIYSPLASLYETMDIAVDCSDDFDTVPTQSQMQAWGTNYINKHIKGSIQETINVSMIDLRRTTESGNGEDIVLRIGDVIKIECVNPDISKTARVVRTVYDPLLESYVDVTLGVLPPTFAKNVIESVNESVEKAVNK